MENQSEKRIKYISIDQGQVYFYVVFQIFLKSLGISWQKIVPQQNGVENQNNRAIMEIAQYMLHSKQMKLNF